MDEIEEYLEFMASKWKYFGLILIGVGMAAGGYWMMTGDEGLFERTMGGLCMVFGVMCFFGISKQLTIAGATIVFTHEGLEDRRWGIGIIPWSEIASVRVIEIQSTKMLELRLRDPEMYLNQMPCHLRLFAGLNQKLGFTNHNLAFTGLTPGIEKAVEYLQQYHPDKLPAS